MVKEIRKRVFSKFCEITLKSGNTASDLTRAPPAMSSAIDCDFAVVGAGIVGAWAALHLARRENSRTVLVEQVTHMGRLYVVVKT